MNGLRPTERPTYDLVLIIPFSFIALMCYWSIYWNVVVFDLPMDGWGIAVGLIGTMALGTVANYTFGIWKLRKNFVWEVLKNG